MAGSRKRTGVPAGVDDADAQGAAVVLLGFAGPFEGCHFFLIVWLFVRLFER